MKRIAFRIIIIAVVMFVGCNKEVVTNKQLDSSSSPMSTLSSSQSSRLTTSSTSRLTSSPTISPISSSISSSTSNLYNYVKICKFDDSI